MKREQFFKVLEKMGACYDGVCLAKASSGAVFTVALRWARSGEWSTEKGHYEWLQMSVYCICGRKDCGMCGLSRKEQESLVKLIKKVEKAKRKLDKYA